MKTTTHRRLGSLLALALLLVFGPTLAHAGMNGIRDGAGFFSDDAKRRAERTIDDLERTAKTDLLIETFAQIPAELTQGVETTDKAAMNRLFEKWSIDKAREHKVNGIYVLLNRQPAHLQVAVGNETQRKAFTLTDRNNLVDTMLRDLRAKRPDDALQAGVGFVDKAVRARITSGSSGGARPVASPAVPTAARAPREVPGGLPGFSVGSGLIILVVVVLGFLLVARILRGLFGGGAAGNAVPGGGFAGGGGGGFMRSMLGGVFGAAAGMWLYDRFTGHGTAWGSDNVTGGNSPDNLGAGQDTDYTSSGGSFGDSSSDGGFGGGGGDFGGGDSGGGGGGDF